MNVLHEVSPKSIQALFEYVSSIHQYNCPSMQILFQESELNYGTEFLYLKET